MASKRRSTADALAARERAFVAAAPAGRRRAAARQTQLGVRVPADLAERLRLHAADRLAAGTHPLTAAGIVAAALTAWLDAQQAGGAASSRQLAQQLRAVADQLERRK